MNHFSAIGRALNPSAPEPDDRLTSYVEEIEQEGLGEFEQDIASRIWNTDGEAELVKVLADASKSGLIQRIAEGRGLPKNSPNQMQAFRALAKLADRLESDRNERVMAEAERRREEAIDLAVSP